MGFQFGFGHVLPLKGTWNPFFMILSLFMAVNGAFTAIQFIETLVQKKETSASHTSKKVSALFSVFACAWCIGVNCVWVMHFLAMSAGLSVVVDVRLPDTP
jgi:NO-binding membrane sensor protein with MHYT domain